MNKKIYILTKNNDFFLYAACGFSHLVWIVIFYLLHGAEFKPMMWWNVGASVFFILLILFYNKINKVLIFTLFAVELTAYALFESIVTKMVCGTELYIMGLIPATFLFMTKYKRPRYYFFAMNLFFICSLAFIIFLKLSWLPPEKLFAPERKFFFWTSQLFCATIVQLLTLYSCLTTEILMRHITWRTKHLQSELEYTANHDVLTGLMNRRRTNTVFNILKLRKETEGVDYAISIFDIDDFKRINDTYGHDAGDFVLKAYTRAIWHSLPNTVKIARWGGEEFLIIYPERTNEIIFELEDLRARLVHTPFVYNGTKINISATFGISSSKNLNSTEEVLTDADHMLLDGKQHGKNRIVVSNNY